MPYNIVAISGSLRKASYNSALLRAFKERAPEGVNIEILDISSFVVYDQDMDADFPAPVQEIKDKIKAADGVILATPEYNRSMSSPMKNFMDWTSRPYGTSPWAGKPVYTIGATIAQTGTAIAQADLRRVLLFLNAIVLGQPEFYLGQASNLFNEEMVLTDETTMKFIDGALVALTAMIDRLK
jgi:chromate reductase, NAD(P)H dehydrogenase (quinone)